MHVVIPVGQDSPSTREGCHPAPVEWNGTRLPGSLYKVISGSSPGLPRGLEQWSLPGNLTSIRRLRSGLGLTCERYVFALHQVEIAMKSCHWPGRGLLSSVFIVCAESTCAPPRPTSAVTANSPRGGGGSQTPPIEPV